LALSENKMALDQKKVQENYDIKDHLIRPEDKIDDKAYSEDYHCRFPGLALHTEETKTY
jgi:hypothetical protein